MKLLVCDLEVENEHFWNAREVRSGWYYSWAGCKAYRIGSRRHVRALLSANRLLYRRPRTTHDFISANERLLRELTHFISKMQVLQCGPDAAILIEQRPTLRPSVLQTLAMCRKPREITSYRTVRVPWERNKLIIMRVWKHYKIKLLFIIISW